MDFTGKNIMQDTESIQGFWRKFTFFILLLLGGVCVVWICNGRPLMGIDDANIFFGYAENIVKGLGITYSTNGVHVEGCTSLLWLLVCALNFAIGFNECGVFLCSLACLIIAQILWVKTLRKLRCNTTIYYALILSCPAYITWMSITLMDTAVWGLLLAWLAYVLFDEIEESSNHGLIAMTLPFVISPLARPESAYVVLITLLTIGAHHAFCRKSMKPVFVIGLSFCAMIGIITLFRIWYFGFPLPNTYYAKVSPSFLYNIKCGIIYAGLYLSAGFPTTTFAIGSVLFLCNMLTSAKRIVVNRTIKDAGMVAVLAWTMLLMFTPVLTGGDHFELHRFYQPLYPAICVLLAVGMRLLEASFPHIGRPLPMAVIACSLCAFGWAGRDAWFFALAEGSSLKHEFQIANNDYLLGMKLNDMFEHVIDLPVVGAITAGGISRTYRGQLVDLMGLNDIRIAHHKGNRHGLKNHAAFEPDIFPDLGIDILAADPIKSSDLFLKGMCGKPEFAAGWQYGILHRRDRNLSVTALFAKGWLKTTLETGHYSYEDKLSWDGHDWKESPKRANPDI